MHATPVIKPDVQRGETGLDTVLATPTATGEVGLRARTAATGPRSHVMGGGGAIANRPRNPFAYRYY